MAHAEDIVDISGTSEMLSEAAAHRPTFGATEKTATRTVKQFGPVGHETVVSESADFATATACEERAQRLTRRLEDMESSIQLTRMALSASEAIEEMLVESRRLLEKGRQLSEPSSRNALASTYLEIKNQIDDIVAEAGINGRNLAAGDSLEIVFDEDKSHFLQIDSAALSVDAMGLSSGHTTFDSDAELIEAIMQIESAICHVRTRRTVIETTLSALVSRAKFMDDKIHSLRDATQTMMGQDKAYASICEIASRRLNNEALEKVKRQEGVANSITKTNSLLQASPDIYEQNDSADEVQEASASEPTKTKSVNLTPVRLMDDNPDQLNDTEELDYLAKEVACHLKIDSYLNYWFKFEAGETGIFARRLSQLYGPDLIAAVAKKLRSNKIFKDEVEKYTEKFEVQIKKEVTEEEGKADQKQIMDNLLKTDQGTLYVALIKAIECV